jgi:cytochrome P450
MYNGEEIYTFLKETCLPFILLAASVLLLRRTTQSKKKGSSMAIPGNPRGKYYLLGDTLELLNPKSMATYQLSRRKQFGPVWQTSVLFNKCIFVSGAENLRQLSDQERLHKNTTACFPPHHRALFGQHSVLVTSGEEHATLRSLITPSLQPSLYEEEIQMAVVAFVSR